MEPELIAARAMLDEIYQKLPSVDGDSNNYTFGRIGQHNVVVTCLPSGTYGTTAATQVASHMTSSFPSLRFRLLVGIGGGVPKSTGDDSPDIRLGDVVVSDPTDNAGGVIQYDLGRKNEGEQWIERTGTLNKPPGSIRSAVMGLKANHKSIEHPLKDHLARMIQENPRYADYAYPGEENDTLFQTGYIHEGRGTSCADCLKCKSVQRSARQSTYPCIHYGTIASGNQVIKDSVTRDYWGSTKGILCFEMEAAGLMDNFPCLVIRGICDYADSHKNTKWQPYAAATAAAYAKDLLLEIAPSAVQAIDRSLWEQAESGA